MKVQLHWAERFINWYPFNTQLYIRGAKGADHEKAFALTKQLFDALAPFLDQLKREARAELARQLQGSLDSIIRNTPHSCLTEEHCCALHAAHKAAAEKVVEHLKRIEHEAEQS